MTSSHCFPRMATTLTGGTRLGVLTLSLILSACAAPPHKSSAALETIKEEMGSAAQSKRDTPPSAVTNALLPPLRVELPKGSEARLEPRFDLLLNNAPAAQVFLSMVSGTRYSMLLHPEVSGNVSLNLKDVNVKEALDTVRELYGYDYRIDGSRIYVYPATLQNRIFQVNYLLAERKGSSDVRVTSGSVVDSGTPTGSTSGSTPTPATPTGGGTRSLVSSRITTTSNTNFWSELSEVVKAIIGDSEGRNVVVSPQTGIIVVRAMPNELRNVETYLKRAQLTMERQVILEAKIMKVDLTNGNQAGINWAALNKNNQHGFSVGANTSGFNFPSGTATGTSTATTGTSTTTTYTATVKDVLGAGIATAGGTTAGLFGIAFQTGSFATVMDFLDTQGTTHVLSSPRIATLNNQQAVLKVGTDQFFVTNVSSSTTTTAAGTSSLPNVTLQPFFSGIVLDVTPQIDEDGNIILHVHPAVSNVTEVQKNVSLGTAGNLTLPLAQSEISETDSIIRASDGQIVAIGGLMKQQGNDVLNQVPGLGNIPGLGALFRNSSNSNQKQELVILLKATVVQSPNDWNQDIMRTQERIRSMTATAKKPLDRE